MKINDALNRELVKSTRDVANSFRKLSSGKRIEKAADGPAELAVAEKLSSESKILKKGSENISYAQSAISIADGALEQVGNIDQRLAELSAQSSNGVLSDDQRAALNQEYQALSQERDRIAETTTFNDKKLLNNESSINIETGTGDPIAVNFGSVESSATQDISTQEGAKAALDRVSSDIASVSQTRAELGASDSRLSTEQSNIDTRVVNYEQAESRIRDVDVAEEVAALLSAKIRQQANTALNAHTDKITKGLVLDLLS